MNRLLNSQQIAEMLDCTPGTVEDKWRAGELPGIKIGRSWLVTEVALFAALDTQCMTNIRAAAAGAVEMPQALGVMVPAERAVAANTKRFRDKPPPLPALPSKAVG